jgi:hypothetical protein
VAIDFAINLPKKWLLASYHIKQRLQFLLFPEGITYNRENDQSRTTRINSVFLYLAYLKQVILKQERGIPALQLNYSSLSCSVEGSGKMSNFLEDIGSVAEMEKLLSDERLISVR